MKSGDEYEEQVNKMDDNQLAKIPKNGKPNISRSPGQSPKHCHENLILISQAHGYRTCKKMKKKRKRNKHQTGVISQTGAMANLVNMPFKREFPNSQAEERFFRLRNAKRCSCREIVHLPSWRMVFFA